MLHKLIQIFAPIVRRMPPAKETHRCILFENKDVAIVGFRWKKGQGLAEHDHYGKCMFQVLNGKLIEKRSNGIQRTLQTNDIGKINKGEKHAIEPLEDSRSIHVYSPPPPCLKKK